MQTLFLICLVGALASTGTGQRIQTVEVSNSRYFISNVSPYSPTLNWFLAYEYCRNIGMELLALEQLEETNEVNAFLKENNYIGTEYWTSGNQLGSAMWLWMSTGQPFNSTFNNWTAGGAPLTKSQQSCMSTKDTTWSPHNCMDSKAFICEQTRCFYYNYVTTNRASSQGNSTVAPGVTRITNRPRVNRRPIQLPNRRTPLRPTQANTQIQTSQRRPLVTPIQSTTPITKIMVTMSDTATVIPDLESTDFPTEEPQTTFFPQTKVMPTETPELVKVMPGTTQQPIKVMPTTTQQPIKVMPTSTQQPIKVMPGSPQQPIKVMPGSPQQPIKEMPGTTEQPIKVMPGNTQQPIKVMPIVLPSIDDPSTNTANNEIVPADPNFSLRLLQPPIHEFTPGKVQEPTTDGSVNLMEILSRKETFSWALEEEAAEQPST